MKKIHPVSVRWMIERDLPALAKIDSVSHPDPWTVQEFKAVIAQSNVIGQTAEIGGEVVGFMIYELHHNRIDMLALAVAPYWRRCKVGQALLDKLIGKLSDQYRSRIRIEVRETNLDGQLFLRAMGFQATQVMREWFEDTDEDAFVFEYRLNVDAGVEESSV